jgi:hypothetical protein
MKTLSITDLHFRRGLAERKRRAIKPAASKKPKAK